MHRRGNAAQQIDAALVPVVLWADEYLYSHASSLHFFRKPATLWGMTTLQLGLHQIEQGLAFFKPEERDEAIRGICSLKLLFGRKSTGNADLEAAYGQIEAGIGRVLKSGLTDLFSTKGRNEWAEQIATDAETFAPDSAARARKFWR